MDEAARCTDIGIVQGGAIFTENIIGKPLPRLSFLPEETVIEAIVWTARVTA